MDRFSTRSVLLLTLCFGILGILILSFTNSLFIAAVSRFILGIAHAVAFLGAIRLAYLWLSSYRALAIGVIVTIGLFGGVIAQTPTVLLVDAIGCVI